MKIKNATKKGYLEAELYDGVYFSYLTFNTRRGRVQKQQAHTITCQCNVGVVVYDKSNSRDRKKEKQ